jgi:hypothetical protein
VRTDTTLCAAVPLAAADSLRRIARARGTTVSAMLGHEVWRLIAGAEPAELAGVHSGTAEPEAEAVAGQR